MSDLIFVPLAGVGTLAMTKERFEMALSAGGALSRKPEAPAVVAAAPSDDRRLVDAEQLEQQTGVPKTWWMTQARERRIPFRKIGRRVRFALDEVLACETFKRRELLHGDSARR